jgi:hypothetical protein
MCFILKATFRGELRVVILNDSSIWAGAALRLHIRRCSRASPGPAIDDCRLLVRNVNVIDDFLDAWHLTDGSFGVSFCQTAVDNAIQIHDIIQRLHSDRSGWS